MKNYINFLFSSFTTYFGIYFADINLSIPVLPPDVWELIKIVISGLFGLLTTIIINYLKKRWKIKDSEWAEIDSKVKDENQIKKKSTYPQTPPINYPNLED